jgi:predicted nicotinamide N-methyase
MPDALALLKKLRRERKEAENSDNGAGSASNAPPQQKADATHADGDSTAIGCKDTKAKSIWDEESLFTRSWEVYAGDETESTQTLRLLEDPTGKFAAGNGATLWDSALALARFIEHVNRSRPMSGSAAIELGSGIGLLSMTLASLGACPVLSTEREIAVQLLQKNVEANGFDSSAVQVLQLDWTQPLPAEVAGSSFGLIVGADLAFPSNSPVFSALADLLASLLQQCPNADCWLGHEPRREDVEAQFWHDLAARGVVATRVPAEQLPEGIPTDIWIMHLIFSTTKANS